MNIFTTIIFIAIVIIELIFTNAKKMKWSCWSSFNTLEIKRKDNIMYLSFVNRLTRRTARQSTLFEHKIARMTSKVMNVQITFNIFMDGWRIQWINLKYFDLTHTYSSSIIRRALNAHMKVKREM
jgi:aminoglycoside N3'-acetyltransferase